MEVTGGIPRKSIRVLALLIGLAICAALAAEADLVVNLRGFEYPYLWRMIGPQGLVLVLAANLWLLVVLRIAWRTLLIGGFTRPRILEGAALLPTTLLLLWFADWVYINPPLTDRLITPAYTPALVKRVTRNALAEARADGDLEALTLPGTHPDDAAVAIMAARIRANRPRVYARYPLGQTIRHYADKYSVSPILLFSWAYLDSFYGQAGAARMPFFTELSGESFRDLVQVHLPWWFVENPIRIALIKGTLFDTLFGHRFGQKLRYAFQKATLDVSVDPYDTNLYTDVLLIMQTYPQDFPSILGPDPSKKPIDSALRRAFQAIRTNGLLKPYGHPYIHAPRDAAYYARYREHLITFARAAFYKMELDFPFATKVQALVIHYYMTRYERALGPTVWSKTGEHQRLALVAMLRDVYIPDIGHLSYNLYMLPEFNCTPYPFVLRSAEEDPSALTDAAKLWRPKHYLDLWAAATFKLRALGETWEAMTGTPWPYPYARAAHTLSDAILVLGRH